jgi:8-oxo-dGTP pyrophosphatase MutT (NUDIX family)
VEGERTLLCSVERAASALFGIVTYGCHMSAYVRSSLSSSSPSSVEDLKLWVPRRAATKSTYPSMLDNTVAGGIATGESPFECIVREAAEEASLPEELVRRKARSVGAVTYFHVRDERAGGETGLLMPECQFVYDLDLTPERQADGKDMEREVTPKPEDGEVEGFELMGVSEVKDAMRKGEFKPNCAVVLLDFFVRHGLITAEDEEGFVEICGRLHRRLEFVKVDGET